MRQAQALPSSIEVNELTTAEVGLQSELTVEIYESYARDELVLPSLPDIAMKIRDAVENPDATARDIERIVTADPAVAARLLQVANSPAFAGTIKVESCRDAVTRLGFSTTREIVTAIVMKGLFKSDSSLLKRLMRALWRHSTLVAAVSYHLAKAQRGFNPDRALLAGLVHDIGVLPVIAAAQGHVEELLDNHALESCLSSLRGQIGALVLRKWDFPDDLVNVALECEDWRRDHTSEADYCDLVMVAQVFALAGTPQFAGLPPILELPAFDRLTGGTLSAEQTLEMLDRARFDIEVLQTLLAR